MYKHIEKDEKKLTDEEIVKDIEANIKYMHDNGFDEILVDMEDMKQYLNIIHRLQAKIDKKQAYVEDLLKELDRSIEINAELQTQVYGLKAENGQLRLENNDLEANLEKAYEIERANIQAEIAEAGTSCHWCKEQTVKDTAKEILIPLIDCEKQIDPLQTGIRWSVLKGFCKKFSIEV